MLNIISCAYWPSVCLLWNVCLKYSTHFFIGLFLGFLALFYLSFSELHYFLPSVRCRFYFSFFFSFFLGVRLFNSDFSCFWRTACIIIAFAASQRLCMVVLSLLVIPRYFQHSSLILSWPIIFLVACCIVSTNSFFLLFLFLWSISSFILLWSKKILEIISALFNLLRFVL